MKKLIKWSGVTASGYKIFEAEGETYQELFTIIQEKYGYGKIINEAYNNVERSGWSEGDYKQAIKGSHVQDIKHTFEERVYFKEIDNVLGLGFDVNDFNIKQDTNGWYATEFEDYLRILRLNEAIDILKENNVDVIKLEANEYQDYIDMASEYEE